jgi:WD40 repeat protein
VTSVQRSRHTPWAVASCGARRVAGYGARRVPTTLLLLVVFAGTRSTAAPPITAAAFAPEGNSVVVGSQRGLQVYSWPELKPVRGLPTELPHIHDLAFSADGQVLAAMGGAPAEHGAIEFHSWPGGDLLSRIEPHADLIYDFAWLADGGCVTASIDGLVQVHDPRQTLLHKLTGHSRGVLAVSLLPDGKTLCTASIDHSIRVWDLPTASPQRNLDQHTAPVVGLALRPTGAEEVPLLASISEDRTVRLWQPTIGRLVRFARLESSPLAVAWTPDGARLVVACRDGSVRTLDQESMNLMTTQAAIDGWAHTLVVSPAGDSCLVGGAGGQLVRLTLPAGN